MNSTSSQKRVTHNDVDLDDQIAEVVVESPPLHGQLLAFSTDGSFTYRPDPGFTGTDTCSYRAFDESLSSSVASVS